LEVFEVTSLSEVISANDVHVMATAWSDLQHLRLYLSIGDPGAEDEDEGDDFRALVSLATLCPKLCVLEVNIGNFKLPPLLDWPHLTHGLRSLELETPNIQDALLLTRLLDRIFPSLQNISVYCYPDSQDQWVNVERTIQMFQEVRKEERARLTSGV
jgi:hypothetical protein